MTLMEAITARHSVRQYEERPIEAAKIEALRQELEQGNQEGGLHMQLVVDDHQAFGSGLAKYGKFSGVGNYIAMIGPTKAEEAIGYYGERAVLTAQTLGLNTCWVGLTFKKQPDRYTIGDGERLHCVIALGYGATQGTQHPQRAIETFAKTTTTMPEWFRRGVEAAMLAPTAVNQQKFEFVLDNENGVTARAKFSLVGYTHIDLGIAKLHFEIGAGKDNFHWREVL